MATMSTPEQHAPWATISLVLGVMSLFCWLLPALGLPVVIIGLIFGIKALQSSDRRKATTGIILCACGLVLTIANAIAGYYLGMHGQNPLVDHWLHIK